MRDDVEPLLAFVQLVGRVHCTATTRSEMVAWRSRLELQKSVDARKMFGSSDANGKTGACGVRSVNGPANVAPNARPMCLWPAETEQFAQPVESADSGW